MADEGKAETLWAWVEQEENGNVGQILVATNAGFTITLTHRRREYVEKLRAAAEAHARASGHKVWLREYRIVADHEEIT